MPHTVQSFQGVCPQIWWVEVDSRSFIPASLRTDNPWYNFQVSHFTGHLLAFLWHRPFFWAETIAVYHSGSYKSQSRTIMGSRESLASAVNLFGGQSGRLKAFQAFCISGNHWMHCLEPFTLDIGFEGFRLCTFCANQIIRLDIWHRTRSFFHPVESLRGNVLLTKGTDSHVYKGSVYNLQGYWFCRTLWNEEISLGR